MSFFPVDTYLGNDYNNYERTGDGAATATGFPDPSDWRTPRCTLKVPSGFSLELIWPSSRVFVKFSPEAGFE